MHMGSGPKHAGCGHKRHRSGNDGVLHLFCRIVSLKYQVKWERCTISLTLLPYQVERPQERIGAKRSTVAQALVRDVNINSDSVSHHSVETAIRPGVFISNRVFGYSATDPLWYAKLGFIHPVANHTQYVMLGAGTRPDRPVHCTVAELVTKVTMQLSTKPDVVVDGVGARNALPQQATCETQ